MKNKKNQGITLISLILTVIILLILTGVAIVTLTGENGLLKRANNAVERAKEAEAVEVIELQLISCRVEYTLNSNVDIPTYIEKENKEITVDGSSNPDNNPVGQWTMTYGGYEFEINDLQIQDYYKTGNKIRPTIKDPKVTEEYQFASIVGSKADVEFKVELPTELTGATVNINVTSGATGTVNGSYDNTTGMYIGTITTDGTTNTNGTYTYEVKATKDGEEYIVKTTIKVSKFLDNPQIEIPEDDKKWNELKIKVTNNYPQDANISYKYYISETTTYGTENFTTDTEVTKTGLTKSTQYNIKVEAYLSNKTTMSKTTIQESTLEKITEIRYIEDLEAINEDLTCNYTLMNDLDFKERSSYKTEDRYNYYNVDNNNDGNPDNSWIPIDEFNGNFNGNYYTISNLYIIPSKSNVGLFGSIKNGSILENTYLKNVNITSNSLENVGGIVGDVGNECQIKRIYVSGNINGYLAVGGIVGRRGYDGVISECFSNCVVTGYQAIGRNCWGTKL